MSLSPSKPIRIGVVTAYPPSDTTLNEYGFHLVRHLAVKPEVGSLVLMCDNSGGSPTEVPEGVEIEPCWRYGTASNPLRVLLCALRTRPDVVLLNAHFTSFGASKVSSAAGLLTPALLRLAGIPNLVLLHNIVEAVDLNAAGFSSNRMMTRVLTRLGALATRWVLQANRVCVTIPQYAEILRDKYKARNVYLTPHGCFDVPPAPELSDEGRQRILAFGKWGTYKKLDDLLEAYRLLLDRGYPDLELVVAGTDNQSAPGYLAGVAESNSDLPGLRFTGYVEEDDVPKMFRDATVAVFPYTSTTGSSGVLHQAGAYGCPVVLPEIGDFVDLVAEEGFAAQTFEPANSGDLSDSLADLLDQPDLRTEIAHRNFAAACGIPLADVADWHLLHLGALSQEAA